LRQASRLANRIVGDNRDANICEQCDNFVTTPEFIPALQAQRTDATTLRDDATERGWHTEVARHSRVITSIQKHLDRLTRRWPPPRPALPHRAVPQAPAEGLRQDPETSAHAAGQQAASSLAAFDAFRMAFLRQGAISCFITPPSRPDPDPDPVTRQDRISELHRRVREYVTARVLTGAPATEDDRRAYARDAAELSRLLDRQRQADQDRGLPAPPAT
jgi:hypothetical protein